MDGPNHCCWIEGRPCDFLTFVDDIPRCSLLLELGTWDAVHKDKRYRESAAHSYFVRNHPGYGCGDWPQLIPEVMASDVGKCCYESGEPPYCRPCPT